MFKRSSLKIDIYDLAEEYSSLFRELFIRLENAKDDDLANYITGRVNFLRTSLYYHHARYDKDKLLDKLLSNYPNPPEKVLEFMKILANDLSDEKVNENWHSYTEIIEEINGFPPFSCKIEEVK